jgi:hypothetical protein
MALGAIVVAAEAFAASKRAFDYGSFSATLGVYVDDNGMVDYEALEADHEKLDAFAAALAELSPEVYAEWIDAEKIAFWINAYNGLTLKAILDHYPIKPSFVASLRFPKNSIRQIPGVWDKLKFRVMDREMTLDEIEHSMLRRDFDEPRIHVALVCAAMGCPPLRNEPFEAEKLGAQLDDQTTRFLSAPDKFSIYGARGRVYLSPIFKWFGDDFVRKYGTDEKFDGHGKSERAVLNFISKYVSESDAAFLAEGEYNIQYLDYDWSLNEQGRAKESEDE